MSTLINLTTTLSINTPLYGALSDGIAIISIVLLLILLVERILLEAYEGDTAKGKTYAFTVLIWPLLFVVATTTFLRFAQVLHLW